MSMVYDRDSFVIADTRYRLGRGNLVDEFS